MVDHVKVRRESMRWNLINTLDKARPHTSSEQFLLDVMRAIQLLIQQINAGRAEVDNEFTRAVTPEGNRKDAW